MYINVRNILQMITTKYQSCGCSAVTPMKLSTRNRQFPYIDMFLKYFFLFPRGGFSPIFSLFGYDFRWRAEKILYILSVSISITLISYFPFVGYQERIENYSEGRGRVVIEKYQLGTSQTVEPHQHHQSSNRCNSRKSIYLKFIGTWKGILR